MNPIFKVGKIYQYPYGGILYKVIEIHEDHMKVKMHQPSRSRYVWFYNDVQKGSPADELCTPATRRQCDLFGLLLKADIVIV